MIIIFKSLYKIITHDKWLFTRRVGRGFVEWQRVKKVIGPFYKKVKSPFRDSDRMFRIL